MRVVIRGSLASWVSGVADACWLDPENEGWCVVEYKLGQGNPEADLTCLRTTSHIQSNMIINYSGAERLLGKGDLFFLSVGEPVRLQAPYLSPEERARIFGGEARG